MSKPSRFFALLILAGCNSSEPLNLNSAGIADTIRRNDSGLDTSSGGDLALKGEVDLDSAPLPDLRLADQAARAETEADRPQEDVAFATDATVDNRVTDDGLRPAPLDAAQSDSNLTACQSHSDCAAGYHCFIQNLGATCQESPKGQCWQFDRRIPMAGDPLGSVGGTVEGLCWISPDGVMCPAGTIWAAIPSSSTFGGCLGCVPSTTGPFCERATLDADAGIPVPPTLTSLPCRRHRDCVGFTSACLVRGNVTSCSDGPLGTCVGNATVHCGMGTPSKYCACSVSITTEGWKHPCPETLPHTCLTDQPDCLICAPI